MNLSSLTDQAAKFAGDKNKTRYSSSDYTTALNRAQEQFALETRSLWKDTTWTTASGTATYNLPSNFMWEDWVLYDGYEIKPISRHEIQRLSPGDDWTDEAGTPTHYIVDPEEANKKIRLYPIPQEVKTLAMRYFPLPTEMTDGADTPLNSSALMAQFHIGLSAYAAWLLLATEEMTDAILMKQREMMAIYTNARDQAIDTFRNTASMPIKIKGARIWR